ncbi:MAG: tRNA (guanosine(37)-N1)-methyltransferase TrmD [Bacteroidota bacterium]
MHFDIITCLPDLLESPFSHSIMKRAQQNGLMSVTLHQLRDYGLGKHRQVDDYQYGGGAGMVMMCEPLANCLDELISKRVYDEVIFLTPDGTVLNQTVVNQLSLGQNYILIAGHYKGIDERIRDNFVTMEISIGDYVLSGGELPAAVLVDAITRVVPGVLNDGSSALSDSHQDGLLAAPVYTRPAEYRGWKVPDVLLSGNDALIAAWRHERSIERTAKRRPDLLSD